MSDLLVKAESLSDTSSISKLVMVSLEDNSMVDSRSIAKCVRTGNRDLSGRHFADTLSVIRKSNDN